MTKYIAILILALVGVYYLYAEESNSAFIHPDADVLGIPWLSSQQEISEVLGPSTGIIEINQRKRAILYGSHYAFILVNGKFNQFVYAESFLYYPIKGRVDNQGIAGGKLVGKKGSVAIGDPFDKVMLTLDISGERPDHSVTYSTDKTMVSLRFTSTGGGNDWSYSLGSFIIEYIK